VDPAFHLAALRELPRPVGVFACNDRIGFGVLEACRQLGLACPEQVAVVGVDNDDVLCALAAIPMTRSSGSEWPERKSCWHRPT